MIASTLISPTERLVADPYNLPALAERMLIAAAEGQREEVARDITLLRKIRGQLPSLILLQQSVLEGGRKVVQRGSCFFIGDDVPSEQFASDLADAVEACAKLLSEPAPVILLNCTDKISHLHLTHAEFPGFSLITISAGSPRFPDGMRRTLFHEVAHCFLRSGAQLLDEGFAIWFANGYSGLPAGKPLAEVSGLPTLRSLLSASGAEGLLFEKTGVGLDQVKAVRNRGAKLIGHIVDQFGFEALRSLFAGITAATSPGQIVRLVEGALGQPLESFDPHEQPATSTQAALVDKAVRGIATAWATKDRKILAELIPALSAEETPSTGLLDCRINALLADAAIASYQGEKVSAEAGAAIDTLLTQANAVGLSAARLCILKGHRAGLLVLMSRGNPIKAINGAQQALHWYTKAKHLTPRDPELLIHLGLIEAHTPAKYGGSRAKGMDYIRQAADDEIWGQWARGILSSFATRPETPAVSPAPTPVKTVTAEREIVLKAANIRLRMSTSFELAPNELIVRRGERVAIVGHNGSGKSLLLESLLGLRRPDSGEVNLLGFSREELRKRPEVRRRLGAVVQHANFPSKARISELVRLHRSIYGEQDATVATVVGLDELMRKEYRTLSRGQRQRVQLYMALAHRPDFILLDEPTLGLDEWFARSLREYWSGTAMKDRTLLLVSHVPADLATVERVMCLGQGKTIDAGTIPDLIARTVGQYRGRVLQPLAATARRDLEQLEGLVRPPSGQEGDLSVYGRGTFERPFRSFLERHSISAFSLEPTRAEDFLAQISHT